MDLRIINYDYKNETSRSNVLTFYPSDMSQPFLCQLCYDSVLEQEGQIRRKVEPESDQELLPELRGGEQLQGSVNVCLGTFHGEQRR